MIFIQALLAAAARSAGRIMHTTFGWATAALFGRLPQRKQFLVSGLALGATVWLALVVGMLAPRFGAFLVTLVPFQAERHPETARLVMAIGAGLLPLVIGAVALHLLEPDARPRRMADRAGIILTGYPYTLAFAVSLLMLGVVVPLMRLRDAARRWTSTPIPLMVSPEEYCDLLDDLEAVLKRNGIPVVCQLAGPGLRWPLTLLATLGGQLTTALVAKKFSLLASPRLEALLYPSALILRGESRSVARAQAILTEHLVFTAAHFTWELETQRVEDQLKALWQRVRDGEALEQTAQDLADVTQAIERLEVPYDAWEALFRERMTVEKELLRRATRQRWAEHAGADLEPGKPSDRLIRWLTSAASAAILVQELKRTLTGRPAASEAYQPQSDAGTAPAQDQPSRRAPNERCRYWVS